MHQNIDEVLMTIHGVLVQRYDEEFRFERDSEDSFVVYTSKNYKFYVDVGFIQDRSVEDTFIPIDKRLDKVLNSIDVVSGKAYKLFLNHKEGTKLGEYFIKEIN